MALIFPKHYTHGQILEEGGKTDVFLIYLKNQKLCLLQEMPSGTPGTIHHSDTININSENWKGKICRQIF